MFAQLTVFRKNPRLSSRSSHFRPLRQWQKWALKRRGAFSLICFKLWLRYLAAQTKKWDFTFKMAITFIFTATANFASNKERKKTYPPTFVNQESLIAMTFHTSTRLQPFFRWAVAEPSASSQAVWANSVFWLHQQIFLWHLPLFSPVGTRTRHPQQ